MARRKKTKPRRKFFKVWSEPPKKKDEPIAKVLPRRSNLGPAVKLRSTASTNKDVIKDYARRVRPYNEAADERAELKLREIFGNAIPKIYHPNPDDALSSANQRPRHELWRERLMEMFADIPTDRRVVYIPGRLWLYFGETRSAFWWVEKDKDGTLRKSIPYMSKERAESVINRITWFEILKTPE